MSDKPQKHGAVLCGDDAVINIDAAAQQKQTPAEEELPVVQQGYFRQMDRAFCHGIGSPVVYYIYIV